MLAAALIGLVLGAAPVASAEPAGPGPNYDFDLYDLGDQLYDLRVIRQAKGTRLVLVDFFAVDCEPCRRALTDWTQLYERYRSKGLRIVVVAIRRDEERDAALRRLQSYFAEHPVPFPVLFDKYGAVAQRYGVADAQGRARLPQVFVFDREGRPIVRDGTAAEVITAVEAALAR